MRPDPVRRHTRSGPGGPSGAPSRRCEKKRSGLQAVQRSTPSTGDRAGLAERLLGRAPEVELPPATTPAPKRLRKSWRHRRPRRSSTGRCPGPIEAARRPPPSAAAPASTTPARRPRQPTCSDRDRRRAAVRASDCDRQAVGADHEQRLAGRVRPEAVSGLAAFPPARRTSGPWTWRPKVERRPASTPTSAQSRRLFSSTCPDRPPSARPRLSVSNGRLAHTARTGRERDGVRREGHPSGSAAARRSGRSITALATDQLACGRQLGLASVEIAAQLPPAELAEHLAPRAATRGARARPGPGR